MANFNPFINTFKETIENTWPMLSLFIIIIVVVRLTFILTHHHKIALYKEFYSLLAIIYLLLLYYLLLGTENVASGVNVIPFKEITRYSFGSKLFMYNVVGNIFLFIPLGYIISDYIHSKKAIHIILISIIISLTAELIQYKIGRAFDVDDVILNTIGGILGYFGYISIQAIKNHLPSFLKNNIFYDLIAICVLIIIIIFVCNIWGIRII